MRIYVYIHVLALSTSSSETLISRSQPPPSPTLRRGAAEVPGNVVTSLRIRYNYLGRFIGLSATPFARHDSSIRASRNRARGNNFDR